MDYVFLLQLQWIVIMTISHRNVRVKQSRNSHLSALLRVHLYVRVSRDGADSSTKVDLASNQAVWQLHSGRAVSRSLQTVLAGVRIRLLFGDVCDRAGPFLKFEKNRHMAARKPRFG